MRRLWLALLFMLIAFPAGAAERWETLPPTPAQIPATRSGHANVNGISVYYAVYGNGPAVILLHGGLANADYWGDQIKALMPRRTVIVTQKLSLSARPPAAVAPTALIFNPVFGKTLP